MAVLKGQVDGIHEKIEIPYGDIIPEPELTRHESSEVKFFFVQQLNEKPPCFVLLVQRTSQAWFVWRKPSPGFFCCFEGEG